VPALVSWLFFSRGGWLTIAGAVVALVIGGGWLALKSAEHGRDVAVAALKKATDEEKAREAASATSAQQSSVQTAEARERAQTVTRTLLKKVTEYVPAAADADCVVPAGFVRLHDAAAQGLSTPAGGPEQAASGVPLSAVTETVVANYGVAYDWRAEALGWRDWYAKQAAIWNH